MDARSESPGAGRYALLALAMLALAWLLLSALRIDLGVLVADVFSVEGAAWAGVAVLAFLGYRFVSPAEA
jgi:hypothetical protein